MLTISSERAHPGITERGLSETRHSSLASAALVGAEKLAYSRRV